MSAQSDSIVAEKGCKNTSGVAAIYGSCGLTHTSPGLMDDDEKDNDNDKMTTPLLKIKSFSKPVKLRGITDALRTLLLFAAAVLFIFYTWRPLYFMIRYGQRPWYHHQSKHSTLPTLLSLRDESDGSLIHSLQNPLYEELRTATFYYADEEPSVILEVERYNDDDNNDSLTLRWKHTDKNNHEKFNPRDIVALYCFNSNISNDAAEETDIPQQVRSTQQLLEVATLAQVQATHSEAVQRLKKSKVDTAATARMLSGQQKNTWYMERFPVRRYSACQFIMYRPETKSTIMSRFRCDEKKATHLHFMGASPLIQLNSVTSPTAIHLSAASTSDPTQMMVSFTTGISGTPVVKYGTDNPPSSMRETGTSLTYTASDMCMEPANQTEPGKFVDPGILHSVVMKNLEPKATYYYQVGLQHGQGVTWSGVKSFVAPLPAGDPTPYSYLVYGDQGCPETGWTTGAAWTAALASKQLPEIRAVHHFGDLSYARGAAHIWDAWLDMIEPVASRVLYHVSVGNHEYDYLHGGTNKDPSGVDNDNGFHPDWGNMGNDSGGECGVPTSKRFAMPQNADTTNVLPSNGVFWYSHDFGLVHTVVLSSEHDMSLGSRQHDWVVADLQSVDRALTPWVVVELHRPLYESEVYWDQYAVGIGERYEIENVLYDYKVDLVLSGHYHAYLRTCDGLYRNRCNQNGPMHITVGTAGASLDDASLYDTEWTANYIKQIWGYGKITVANSSALLFEFIRAGEEYDASTGEVLDYIWLKRDR